VEAQDSDRTTVGAGKTFLSSVVVDHLLEEQQSANGGVAYLYFGNKEQEQQKPLDILAVFTKQLLNQLPELTAPRIPTPE
jgi:hypothetical protein